MNTEQNQKYEVSVYMNYFVVSINFAATKLCLGELYKARDKYVPIKVPFKLTVIYLHIYLPENGNNPHDSSTLYSER